MPAPRKLKKIDIEYAFELQGEGVNLSDIAEKLGVDRTTLYRRMKKMPNYTVTQRPPLTVDEIHYINQDYANGMTIAEICAKWNLSKATAYRALSRKDKDDDDHTQQ